MRDSKRKAILALSTRTGPEAAEFKLSKTKWTFLRTHPLERSL